MTQNNNNQIEPNAQSLQMAVSHSTVYLGDCLIESDKIESGSIDLKIKITNTQ